MVPGLEVKFAGGAPVLTDGQVIEGYASLFGMTDQGGDAVAPGAFGASLARLAAKGDKVRMLWQHDPAKPIGVWYEIREDEKGLWVKGRLLPEVTQAREAAALIQAGAIDGLSIGYRTIVSSASFEEILLFRISKIKSGKNFLGVSIWKTGIVEEKWKV